MKLKRLLSASMACLTAFCMSTTAMAGQDSAEMKGTVVNALLYEAKDDGTAICVGPETEVAPRPLVIEPSVTIDGMDCEVTEVADGAFTAVQLTNASKINSLELPPTLKRIGSNAFRGLSALRSVSIPQGCEEIADQAFYGCKGLESAEIPGSVGTICAGVFQGCENLSKVTLAEGTKAIMGGAFMGCPISEIVLPSTISNLSNGAFGSETHMTVSFAGSPAQWDKATDRRNDWCYGSGANVTCQIPEELIIEKDLEYVSDGEEWLGHVKLNMDGIGPDWTAALQQVRRVLAVWTARNAEEDEYTITMPVTGSEGDEPKAKIYVQNKNTSNNVRVAAEREILFKVGWSPQNWRKWITVSSMEPKSGEKIEICLSPKDGYVDAQLCAHEGLETDNGKVLLSSTGADGYARSATIEVTVTGEPGDRIPLVIEGSFRHELGHGEYRAVLGEAVIAEAAEQPAAPSQPAANDDTAGGKTDDDPKDPGEDDQAAAGPSQKPGENNEPQGSEDSTPTREPDEQRGPDDDKNEPNGEPTQPGTPSAQPTHEPPTQKPTNSPSPSPGSTVSASPSHTQSPSPSPSPSQKPKEDGDGEDDSQSPEPSWTGWLPKLKDNARLLMGFINSEPYLSGDLSDDGTSQLSVGDALRAFALPDELTVEIIDHEGRKVEEDAPLATGYEAVFRTTSSGEVVARIPIVIMGDVCGTGAMSLTQVVRTAKGFTGKSRLVGCYMQAADFDRNHKVDLTDVVKEAKLFKNSISGGSAA